MSLENTTNEEAISLASAPIEELDVARAQYNPDVKSIFTKAYKYAQDVLGSTSKRVSNFIGSYSDRLKTNLRENHASPYLQKQRGFTLTELLVTIAITGGLMAILLPSLQRVRKEAKSTVCQSNQRQIGLMCVTNTLSDLGGMLKNPHSPSLRKDSTDDAFLCPMAKKLGTPQYVGPIESPYNYWFGDKFSAWGYGSPRKLVTSSYGFNSALNEYTRAKNSPMFLDCADIDTGLYPIQSTNPPPKYDNLPGHTVSDEEAFGANVCMDRHNGSVNYLFLDASARKVGLKELWTLKWHKDFNTAGPWTKAGGVQPEDWPEWMRKFKDY